MLSQLYFSNPQFGGNNSAIQRNASAAAISQVECGSTACAFLSEDGRVDTVGMASFGGDAFTLSNQLYDIVDVVAGDFTFGALRADGTALHWGYEPYGGSGLMRNVTRLFGGRQARAVLFENGTLYCWGNNYAGGSCLQANQFLSANGTDLKSIQSNANAFLAHTYSGRGHAWGNPRSGGDPPAEVAAFLLEDIVAVAHIETAFAALKSNGTAMMWGTIQSKLQVIYVHFDEPIQQIYSTADSFLFQTTQNSIYSRGELQTYTSNVSEVALSSGSSFAVIHSNGSVTTYGGSSTEDNILEQLQQDIIQVAAGGAGAFAAVKSDGSLITWGDVQRGGNHTSVKNFVSQGGGVERIWANHYSFVAKLKNPQAALIAWGDPNRGGNISTVASQLSGEHVTNVVPGIDTWTVIVEIPIIAASTNTPTSVRLPEILTTPSPTLMPLTNQSIYPSNRPSTLPQVSPIPSVAPSLTPEESQTSGQMASVSPTSLQETSFPSGMPTSTTISIDEVNATTLSPTLTPTTKAPTPKLVIMTGAPTLIGDTATYAPVSHDFSQAPSSSPTNLIESSHPNSTVPTKSPSLFVMPEANINTTTPTESPSRPPKTFTPTTNWTTPTSGPGLTTPTPTANPTNLSKFVSHSPTKSQTFQPTISPTSKVSNEVDDSSVKPILTSQRPTASPDSGEPTSVPEGGENQGLHIAIALIACVSAISVVAAFLVTRRLLVRRHHQVTPEETLTRQAFMR